MLMQSPSPRSLPKGRWPKEGVYGVRILWQHPCDNGSLSKFPPSWKKEKKTHTHTSAGASSNVARKPTMGTWRYLWHNLSMCVCECVPWWHRVSSGVFHTLFRGGLSVNQNESHRERKRERERERERERRKKRNHQTRPILTNDTH